MDEKELREKVFREIQTNLKMGFENCACLGRQALIDDGFGVYTEKMVKMIENIILNPDKRV